MKKSWRAKLLVRKNRLKCRSDKVGGDCCKAIALLAMIFVLVCTLIFSYSYVVTAPYFRIKETQVRGCRELTEKDVLKLAALKPSQTVFSVNLKALARSISSNPWVKKVAIAREFPHGLVVEIEERKALAMCRIGDEFHLMDEEGVLFKKFTSEDDVDVPVLTGYYQGGQVNRELLNTTLGLLKQLALSKNFPTIGMVSEINGSEVAGLSLFTDNGFSLELGFGNYEGKLQRLLPVLTALHKRNVPAGFLNIDLRNISKVYVERRLILEPAGQPKAKKGFST